MEKLVEELEYQVPFKNSTNVGDIVVFVNENDNNDIAVSYAKVMDFERDPAKRDEWWHVKFIFLSVPPIVHTITLQTQHFTGQEIFTIGGRKTFIKSIDFSSFKDPFVDDDNLNAKLEEKKELKKSETKKNIFKLIK